jgi:hypothetical protein
MVGGSIDPETGLSADVQISDYLNGVLELDIGFVLPVATVTPAALGQRPGDFKAVALAVALISRDGDLGREIDLDRDSSHDLLLGKPLKGMSGCPSHTGILSLNHTAAESAGKPRNRPGLHLKTEDP